MAPYTAYISLSPPWDALAHFELECIPEFNDTVGQTIEQVLEKFDQAIERAKNAESS